MSKDSELQDIEARIVLNKMKRRDRLRSIIYKTPLSSAWHGIVADCIFILLAAFDSGNTTFAWALVGILIMFGVYIDNINKRLDALVKILEQDGIVQDNLPISKNVSRNKEDRL
ncbi:MAG: hypothetical protein O7C75_11785 [Verrucomicrobia bacterium]|nr:hypothetical protein [Verrucomicrobiota bacterium]